MAISDRITSIEEHIKESYQELEGIGIDTTGVNNNLENIPKLIDGYWGTLPKVTGEGTSITLDNTKEGKMKINLKGNTSQETTTGKNLWGGFANTFSVSGSGITFTSNSDGSITLNGTATANVSRPYSNDVTSNNWYKTLQADTYTISSYGLPTGVTLTITNTSGSNLYTGITNSRTFILSQETSIFVRADVSNGTSMVNKTIQIQIEKGSTATSYEPYTNGASPNPDYPQDIHVVSGDNSINVCGKNLFDKDNAEQIKNWFVTNNKIEARNGTTLFFIKCEPSTQYTISKISSTRLQFWCSVEKPAIGVATSNALNNDYNFTGTTKTITTTSDAQWLICYYYNANSDTKTEQEIRNSIQIEKGNQATTYEAYKGASYPITLPEGMFLGWIPNTDYRDIIFQAKTGDTYYDSLDSTTKESLTYGKWYLNKQISKGVLNGSESWNTYNTATSSAYSFVVSNIKVITATTIIADLLCNYYIKNTQGELYNETQDYCIAQRANQPQLLFRNKDITTLNDFKTWLSTHNTIVYYVLATPTYTEITDSTLLSQLNALAKSYASQTNISQESNDLASILNTTALSE